MENITFRHSTLGDAETIVNWRSQSFVMSNFFGNHIITLEEHKSWFRENVLSGKTEQFIFEANRQPIGSFYFKNIDNSNQKAEYGIYIGEKDYFSKGIGTIVTKYAADYAFGTLKLHRLYLYVFAHNFAAIRCYEKCGFIQEGLLRDDILINNNWNNVILMAIITPPPSQIS